MQHDVSANRVKSIHQRENEQRNACRTSQYGLLADDFGTRHSVSIKAATAMLAPYLPAARAATPRLNRKSTDVSMDR
jgi:hypothetical protein